MSERIKHNNEQIILEKDKYYKVKITNFARPELHDKSVKVRFTGIMFRGKNSSNALFLNECEILKEISKKEFDL